MAVQLQLRRDTAANWTATNPTLAQGEAGYETDTDKLKVGDGVTAWTGLAYFTGSGSDAVTTQDVAPATASYDAVLGDRVGITLGTTQAVVLPAVAGAGTSDIVVAAVAGTGTNSSYGALSTALTTGSPITSLPVLGNSSAFGPGPLTLNFGGQSQTFVTTGAAAHASSIPITSATPNYAYPLASQVTGLGGGEVTVTTADASNIVGPAGPVSVFIFDAIGTAITFKVIGGLWTALGAYAPGDPYATRNPVADDLVLAPSTVPTATFGGVAAHGLYVPTLQPPPLHRSGIVAEFGQGLGAWTHSGTGAAVLDSTTYAQYPSAAKLTTDGAGGACRFVCTSLTPFDLTTQMLRVKYFVDQPSLMGNAGLQVSIGSSAGFGNNYYSGAVIATQSSGWQKPMQPTTIHIALNDLNGLTGTSAGTTGSPVTTAFNTLQFTVIDNNTGTPINVWIQSVELVPNPASGLVCIMFDDGYLNNLQAAEAMDVYGFRGTCHLIRDAVAASEGGSSQYLAYPDVNRLYYEHNWDMACHADTIANHNAGLTTLSATAFEAECMRMKGWMLQQGWFRGADFFAWPLGAYTQAYLAIARRYFAGIRTFQDVIAAQINDAYPFGDPTQMRGMAVVGGSSPSSASSVNTAIDAAVAANKTVILTFHDVAGTDPTQSTTYPLSNFEAIMAHIAAAGYAVPTVREIFLGEIPLALKGGTP